MRALMPAVRLGCGALWRQARRLRSLPSVPGRVREWLVALSPLAPTGRIPFLPVADQES
jgi:hypothetical protein